MTDLHDLITRMADELDYYRQLLTDDRREVHALAMEARAALAAEAEPEGPSAEDVEELCEEHGFIVEGCESIECLQGLINEAIARWGRPAPVTAEGEVVEPTDEELWQVGDEDFRANTWPTDTIRYARAVLARFGRPSPTPQAKATTTDD